MSEDEAPARPIWLLTLADLSLLLDFVPGRAGEAVADPYYGEDAGFDETWADVTAGAQALAERLKRG